MMTGHDSIHLGSGAIVDVTLPDQEVARDLLLDDDLLQAKLQTEHHHVLHPDPADDDLLLHDRGQALLQQQPRGAAGRRHTSGIIVCEADLELLKLFFS